MCCSHASRIRGVFEFIVKTQGRFSEASRDSALRDALALLEIAADLDSATGGSMKILPAVKILTADGIETLPEEEVREWMGRDPIPSYRARLEEAGVEASVLDQIEADAKAAVAEAETAARSAPDPDPATATTQVWADGGSSWRT